MKRSRYCTLAGTLQNTLKPFSASRHGCINDEETEPDVDCCCNVNARGSTEHQNSLFTCFWWHDCQRVLNDKQYGRPDHLWQRYPVLCPVESWIILERRTCLYSVDCKLNISILKCYTGNMRTCSGQDCVRSVPITEHGRRNPRKFPPDVYVERVKRPFLLRNYKIVYCSVLFLVCQSGLLFLFLWKEKRFLMCMTI